MKKYSPIVMSATDELPIERQFNFAADGPMEVTSSQAI